MSVYTVECFFLLWRNFLFILAINAAVIIHSQIIHSQYFRNNELKKINGWTAIVRKVRSLIIGSVRRKKKAIKQCKSNHIPQTSSVSSGSGW